MKVGLSYSRCLVDLYEGVVDIDDVLVIIARTDFNPHIDEEWEAIWNGYHIRQSWSSPEWQHYPTDKHKLAFRAISMELYDSGKLHQPRKFGAGGTRRSEIWLETVLPDTELDKRPAVKEAWDKFQVLAELTSTKLDKDYQ